MTAENKRAQASVITRNLHGDLAICEAATPGPWKVRRQSPNGLQNVGTRQGRMTAQTFEQGDATFIAEAREGWPEAIRRAIAAETEVERLTAFIESESERATEAAYGRELLSHIISAFDRGDFYKTKMSYGLDHLIDCAREVLRK